LCTLGHRVRTRRKALPRPVSLERIQNSGPSSPLRSANGGTRGHLRSEEDRAVRADMLPSVSPIDAIRPLLVSARQCYIGIDGYHWSWRSRRRRCGIGRSASRRVALHFAKRASRTRRFCYRPQTTRTGAPFATPILNFANERCDLCWTGLQNILRWCARHPTVNPAAQFDRGRRATPDSLKLLASPPGSEPGTFRLEGY